MSLAMRLGRTLGELAGLGPEISAFEWDLWIVWLRDYDPARPCGDQQKREDLRFGMLLALTKNLHSSRGSFEPKDFFPSLAAPALSGRDADKELERRFMARSSKIINIAKVES